jgi:hypothetical protein
MVLMTAAACCPLLTYPPCVLHNSEADGLVELMATRGGKVRNTATVWQFRYQHTSHRQRKAIHDYLLLWQTRRQLFLQRKTQSCWHTAQHKHINTT